MDTAKFDDAYFKSAEKKGRKQSEEGFFAEAAEKAPLPAEYVANQKAADAALLGKLRCVACVCVCACVCVAGGGGWWLLSARVCGTGGGCPAIPARWRCRPWGLRESPAGVGLLLWLCLMCMCVSPLFCAPPLPASCSDDLKGYLSTRFTLRAGDRPHLMKF